MKNNIAELEPKIIWKHFYKITQIPHPSGHEAAIIGYLEDFARQHSLVYEKDKAGNLIIRKPATPGREKVPGVILQSHVDMVPQKNADKNHDFQSDPIEALIDGEWVHANQTTLGADNGIGVAATLAVLESADIKHGPVEALFTISEETGMDGAFGLDEKSLSGSIMLNLDSEEEGELFIGCAGGVDVNISAGVSMDAATDRMAMKLSLSGLKGGHSGMDINLGRGNANLDLMALITELSKLMDVRIHSFNGGDLRNAIPREAEAIVTLIEDDIYEFESSFSMLANAIIEKYEGAEEEMEFNFEQLLPVDDQLSSAIQEKIISTLMDTPNGVIRMADDMPDVVQTSNNIAIVKIGSGKLDVKMLLRSASDSEKESVAKTIANQYTGIDANVELSGAYPGWLPNSESAILKTARQTYKSLFGKEPEVKVIHAGLETGIIAGKYPELDMISFGPTIKFPHSPDEKVNIPTVFAFWKYLRSMLEAI